MATKSSLPIDIGRIQVGRLYATAYIRAAEASGELIDRLAELESLVEDVLDRYPEADQMLVDRMMVHRDRSDRIDRIFQGRASELLINFLKVLSAHDRLDCLRYVLQEAKRLYLEMQNKVEAYVSSALPLSAADEAKLRTRLTTLIGRDVELVVSVDPDLLGGVVIRVGDKMFDGSVRHHLDRMRGQIVSRSVHKIQENREQFAVL